MTIVEIVPISVTTVFKRLWWQNRGRPPTAFWLGWERATAPKECAYALVGGLLHSSKVTEYDQLTITS